jgi:hypothetical protein
MGLFSRSSNAPNLVTIGERRLHCMFCQGQRFWYREVKMNTTGMEFFDMAWANQSAHGLICAACGYVHEFMGDNVRMWQERDA